MTRGQFTLLTKQNLIYNNDKSLLLKVNSIFIDPNDVEDEDVLICVDFFNKNKTYQIEASEHKEWDIFIEQTFLSDVNQDIINKILLKKIMLLEQKNITISNILKS